MTNPFFHPTVERIRDAQAQIQGALIATPVLALRHAPFAQALGPNAWIKLELFQHAGSFKARGVFLAIQALDAAQREAGVVAVSAGNHAIATAWGAKAVGVDAKVCLPKTADPFRVAMCEALGAQVVMCEDIADSFAQLERIQADEGRTLLHPFESPYMTLGGATCAAEYLAAVPQLEVAVVPVGGGGFISGMAAGFKLLKPSIKVYGVEPKGANVVSRALEAGAPQQMSVDTIADSLGAPMSLTQGFELIQTYVDQVVTVSDDELRASMRTMAETINLLAEPACAASLAAATGPLAAATGPLARQCQDAPLGLVACGSNISVSRWQKLVG